MKYLIKKLWKYCRWLWGEWGHDDTNMFRNSMDALGGIIVLLFFPAVSIGIVICQIWKQQASSFASFTYPLCTIVFADIYDALGRSGTNAALRMKVYVRIGLSITAGIFAIALTFCEKMSIFHLVSFLPLFFNGIILFRDMHTRLSISIDLLWDKTSKGVPHEKIDA